MSGVTNEINLKVKSQEGNEVFFRIKGSTPFKKLMNAYCDRQSVKMNSIAFLFDGRRLRADQTPDELEMEDGDEIDAEAAHQYLERLQAVVLEEQDRIADMRFRLQQDMEALHEAQEYISDMHLKLDQSEALKDKLEARVKTNINSGAGASGTAGGVNNTARGSYKEFLNYKPHNFNGSEGAVGLVKPTKLDLNLPSKRTSSCTCIVTPSKLGSAEDKNKHWGATGLVHNIGIRKQDSIMHLHKTFSKSKLQVYIYSKVLKDMEALHEAQEYIADMHLKLDQSEALKDKLEARVKLVVVRIRNSCTTSLATSTGLKEQLDWLDGLRRWNQISFRICNCAENCKVKTCARDSGNVNVTSSKPTTIQGAICMACDLMDQVVRHRAKVAKSADNKRKLEDNQRGNFWAYTSGPNDKKEYVGTLPYYNKCKLYHTGPCTVQCGNCKKEGHDMFFRIKRSTRFRKLMIAYCEWQSVEMNSIAFLYQVNGYNLHKFLEMEDGDEIDAVATQQYVEALHAALHESWGTLQTLQAAQQGLETLQDELEAHITDIHFQLDQHKACEAELEARIRALEERQDQHKAREAELEARVRALEERLKPSGDRH
ncbi:small ubiquitin-related modifier 2 [Artemisia annua]|uniref:Small ubiquitin-related modifier 2 n=1 Tax=Artemisia annua TaxID=35608 RepID=A0A2U1Q0Z1_ARTAN|nr:small ubiquitin-related modifier 2 [Artemisia annua]